MKRIKEIIFALTHPSHWSRIYSYSSEWDEILNKLMENEEFTNVSAFTANIGGIEVWISNYPFASFRNNRGESVMPKRYTVYKARKKLIKDQFKLQLKKSIENE